MKYVLWYELTMELLHLFWYRNQNIIEMASTGVKNNIFDPKNFPVTGSKSYFCYYPCASERYIFAKMKNPAFGGLCPSKQNPFIIYTLLTYRFDEIIEICLFSAVVYRPNHLTYTLFIEKFSLTILNQMQFHLPTLEVRFVP